MHFQTARGALKIKIFQFSAKKKGKKKGCHASKPVSQLLLSNNKSEDKQFSPLFGALSLKRGPS